MNDNSSINVDLNQNQARLILYTTLGCHLCEEAEGIIRQVLSTPQYQHRVLLESVDIADDPALVESYGIRIPVIKFKQGEKELGWPFESSQIEEFLAMELVE